MHQTVPVFLCATYAMPDPTSALLVTHLRGQRIIGVEGRHDSVVPDIGEAPDRVGINGLSNNPIILPTIAVGVVEAQRQAQCERGSSGEGARNQELLLGDLASTGSIVVAPDLRILLILVLPFHIIDGCHVLPADLCPGVL